MDLLSYHGGEEKEVQIGEGSLLVYAQACAWHEAVEPLQIPLIIFVAFAHMFHSTLLTLWNGGKVCGFFLSSWVESIILFFQDF